VEPLALLEPPDAEQQHVPVPDAVRGADPGAGGLVGQTVALGEIDGVRHEGDALVLDAQEAPDGGNERAIGRHDPIRRPCAASDGPPERQVSRPLQGRAPEAPVRSAEFLEPLRVEDERDDSGAGRFRQREPQCAGAEPMHEVDLAGTCESGSQSSGSVSEQQVGGAAVDDRRAAAPGKREREVGHQPQLRSALAKHLAGQRRGGGIAAGAIGSSRGGWPVSRRGGPDLLPRYARDEGDADATIDQVSDQVIDMSLQAAVPVHPVDGSRQDGDAQPQRGVCAETRGLAGHGRPPGGRGRAVISSR
jgi:hypothetical protein